LHDSYIGGCRVYFTLVAVAVAIAVAIAVTLFIVSVSETAIPVSSYV
jgi:hypothetical protein